MDPEGDELGLLHHEVVFRDDEGPVPEFHAVEGEHPSFPGNCRILQPHRDVEGGLHPDARGSARHGIPEHQLQQGAVDIGPPDRPADGYVSRPDFRGILLSLFVKRFEVRADLDLHIHRATDDHQ